MFYKFARFIVNCYITVYYRYSIIGKENIPQEGGFIICSNHIHWADPVIIACKGLKYPIYFLGKIELFKNKFFSTVLKHLNVIPVKRGESDVHAIKNALRVLKSNKVLGIFPEGTRVKAGEEKKPEGGMALLAIKSKVPILPIGIQGDYSFGSTIHLHIGEPIILSDYFDKRMNKEDLENISLRIMQEIKNLML
ncbi:MAG: lysophospholipid acyltransferase family protein [Eubacteriales bacterium]